MIGSSNKNKRWIKKGLKKGSKTPKMGHFRGPILTHIFKLVYYHTGIFSINKGTKKRVKNG